MTNENKYELRWDCDGSLFIRSENLSLESIIHFAIIHIISVVGYDYKKKDRNLSVNRVHNEISVRFLREVHKLTYDKKQVADFLNETFSSYGIDDKFTIT